MKLGDDARQALHDMRWGPHIADVIERQNRVDDAIKVALTAIAKLEAENKELRLAGGRLGVAVRRSSAYSAIVLFYKTAIKNWEATFKKDLKLLEPEVSDMISGAVLVDDELAALEEQDDKTK